MGLSIIERWGDDGPDGETGFVEQGGLNKTDKIDQERSLLKASMKKLEKDQQAMAARYAALAKEATNRQIAEVGNKAATLTVESDKDSQKESDKGNPASTSMKSKSLVQVVAETMGLREASSSQTSPPANMGGAGSGDVVMADDVVE